MRIAEVCASSEMVEDDKKFSDTIKMVVPRWCRTIKFVVVPRIIGYFCSSKMV